MLDPTATTHSLLHPPTGSSCLSDTDIFETTLYSRSQLIDIYKNIGKELTMEAVDKVFHSPNRVRENKSKLSQKEDSMSLKSFQDILNRME